MNNKYGFAFYVIGIAAGKLLFRQHEANVSFYMYFIGCGIWWLYHTLLPKRELMKRLISLLWLGLSLRLALTNLLLAQDYLPMLHTRDTRASGDNICRRC